MKGALALGQVGGRGFLAVLDPDKVRTPRNAVRNLPRLKARFQQAGCSTVLVSQ